MFPPRCLVALCVLMALVSVQGRKLKQTASVSDFTNTTNTYLVSTTLVSSSAATSADACISACAADSNCVFFSWCPSTETSGCTVPGVGGGASSTVAASGCVLSYDEVKDRSAVYAATGSGIAFVGGKYSPTNTLPAGSPPAAAGDPASWIDPSGTPAECTGWWAGNQWSGDEIECHVCDGDYQLKCDLDTDLIGDDSVKCEFDSAGLGALVNNAYDFDCVVDWKKTPQNQCPWTDFDSKLPACAVEPVKRILATWKPDE